MIRKLANDLKLRGDQRELVMHIEPVMTRPMAAGVRDLATTSCRSWNCGRAQAQRFLTADHRFESLHVAGKPQSWQAP